MIKGIQGYLHHKRLKDQLSSRPVAKKQGYNAFKNILLYMDGTDGAVRKVVHKYAQELSRGGCHVKELAYVQSKEERVEVGMAHYTTRNINWYQVPQSEDLDLALSRSYDVLIVLLSDIEDHHNYVIQLVQADIKVGPYLGEEGPILFDISVDHKPSLGIPELIKNTKTSLNILSHA